MISYDSTWTLHLEKRESDVVFLHSGMDHMKFIGVPQLNARNVFTFTIMAIKTNNFQWKDSITRIQIIYNEKIWSSG